MKNSCIAHPENEPLIIIRRWQVQACDGDFCAAELLSFFEYWHNVKLAMVERNPKAGLLQFHTEEQLEEGLLNSYGRKAIRRSISRLEALGFIKVGRNPNPRYAFDNKRYVLFCEDVVNEWLKSRNDPKISPSGQKASLSGQKASTITEVSNGGFNSVKVQASKSNSSLVVARGNCDAVEVEEKDNAVDSERVPESDRDAFSETPPRLQRLPKPPRSEFTAYIDRRAERFPNLSRDPDGLYREFEGNAWCIKQNGEWKPILNWKALLPRTEAARAERFRPKLRSRVPEQQTEKEPFFAI